MNDSTTLTRRYFDLAASPDREAYVALFTEDAVVEDDGHSYLGLDAIRGWRHGVPSVTYDVIDQHDVAGATVATAGISGDFTGSPVDLTFTFDRTAAGLIRSLTIRVTSARSR